MALLVVAAERSARPAPIETTILTVEDELLPPTERAGPEAGQTRVLFETPADLPSGSSGAIRFDTEFPGLALDDVKAFLLHQENRTWLGSEASAVEWYRLGPLESPAPPLPGWARSTGGHASWQPAVPAAIGPETPYVNRAQALWSTADAEDDRAGGEFLFRTRLVLDTDGPVASARLHLAVRGEVLDIRLNDRPVRTGNSGQDLRCVVEVGDLLKPGDNILGFRIRNPGLPFVPHPSLAFSLEYTPGGDSRPSLSSGYDQAILNTRHGDRLRGQVLTFNPVSILLRTPWGRYGADWNELESVLFPYGWYDPPGKEDPPLRRFLRFFGFGESSLNDALPDAPPQGVRLSAPDELINGGLLLRDGRAMAEELVAVEGDQVVLRRHESEETLNMARTKIAAIYPLVPERNTLKRPSREFASFHCRLKTTRGEYVSGILRQMNADRIVLEHPGDGILSFLPADVAWVWFPLHGDKAASRAVVEGAGKLEPARKGTAVAILTLPSPGRPLDDETRRLHRDIQQAAFLAGLPSTYPTRESMVDPRRLHARNFPAAVIAENGGAWSDPFGADGDARRAILEYVETGGTLFVHSKQGALEKPRRPDEPDAEATGEDSASSLLRELGFEVVLPGKADEYEVRPFEHPPNLPVTLQMKRHPSMPQGLRSLPGRVEAPDLASAPFYPVVNRSGPEQELYQLVDDAGSIFGPAMLAVRRGDGRIIVIDHLLWESSLEGRAFSQVILPHLLRWAFEIQR